LKNFVEPKLPRRAPVDLELSDCQVGFYDSLVVFDHFLGTTVLVCTGLEEDGARSVQREREQSNFWRGQLQEPPHSTGEAQRRWAGGLGEVSSSLGKEDFEIRVKRALAYIRAGDIYQVNLSHRLSAPLEATGWDLFLRLREVSPAPFSAFLDGSSFQIISSSPELFLKISGGHILTRPIKGTRPRSADPTRDAQLTYELTTSPKEMAELVMITDLLRNDLGRVCEFGSVRCRNWCAWSATHRFSTWCPRWRADCDRRSLISRLSPRASLAAALLEHLRFGRWKLSMSWKPWLEALIRGRWVTLGSTARVS